MTRTWKLLILAAVLLGVVVAASGGQEREQQVRAADALDLPGLATQEAGDGEQPEVDSRARSLMSGYGWNHARKAGRRFHSCSKNATVCKSKKARGPDCCQGRCTRVSSDKNNCGKCGSRCGTGKTCCAGKCVNVYVDASNCGSCGQKCLTEEYCFRGLCNYNGLA